MQSEPIADNVAVAATKALANHLLLRRFKKGTANTLHGYEAE